RMGKGAGSMRIQMRPAQAPARLGRERAPRLDLGDAVTSATGESTGRAGSGAAAKRSEGGRVGAKFVTLVESPPHPAPPGARPGSPPLPSGARLCGGITPSLPAGG